MAANCSTPAAAIGKERFETLLSMAPGGRAACTVVGVDENTALVIEPATGACTVMGTGAVTILRGAATAVYPAGQRFPANRTRTIRPAGTGARHS